MKASSKFLELINEINVCGLDNVNVSVIAKDKSYTDTQKWFGTDEKKPVESGIYITANGENPLDEIKPTWSLTMHDSVDVWVHFYRVELI